MVKKTVGEVFKKYLISAAFTFATGFLITTITYIQAVPSFDFTTFLDNGFWVGLALAGTRAGVKLTWEYLLPLVPKLLKYFKSFIK